MDKFKAANVAVAAVGMAAMGEMLLGGSVTTEVGMASAIATGISLGNLRFDGKIKDFLNKAKSEGKELEVASNIKNHQLAMKKMTGVAFFAAAALAASGQIGGPNAVANYSMIGASEVVKQAGSSIPDVLPKKLEEIGGLKGIYDRSASGEMKASSFNLVLTKQGIYTDDIEKKQSVAESVSQANIKDADYRECAIDVRNEGEVFVSEFVVRHEVGHCLISHMEDAPEILPKPSEMFLEGREAGGVLGMDWRANALAETFFRTMHESQADAYALLSASLSYEKDLVVRMGEAVKEGRKLYGAFARDTGYDTEHAINRALDLIKNGNGPKTELEAVLMASKIGDESVKKWMENPNYFKAPLQMDEKTKAAMESRAERALRLYSAGNGDINAASSASQGESRERSEKLARSLGVYEKVYGAIGEAAESAGGLKAREQGFKRGFYEPHVVANGVKALLDPGVDQNEALEKLKRFVKSDIEKKISDWSQSLPSQAQRPVAPVQQGGKFLSSEPPARIPSRFSRPPVIQEPEVTSTGRLVKPNARGPDRDYDAPEPAPEKKRGLVLQMKRDR